MPIKNTFEEAQTDQEVRRFLRHMCASRRYSDYTLRNYETALEEFTTWYRNQFGKQLSWPAFTREVFRLYLRHLGHNNLGPSSIRVRFAALRTFYRFLTREGLTTTNPVKEVLLPKKRQTLPKFLTKDQIVRLLDAPFQELRKTQAKGRNAPERMIQYYRDAAILETLYSCGIRVGELCNLRVMDIDWNNQLLRVHGKGKKERLVPIGKPALAAIRKYWELLPKRPSAQDPVFLSCRGRAITVRDVQRRLKKYLLVAGLDPSLTPHKIRHTYATHLLDAGADLRSVQEMLGHAQLATTQVYTHVTTQHLKNIYDKTHPRA